jgi:hypothetical protein
MTPSQVAQLNAACIEQERRKPSPYGRLYLMRHKAKNPAMNPGYCKHCREIYPMLTDYHAKHHGYVNRDHMIAAGMYKPIEFKKILNEKG